MQLLHGHFIETWYIIGKVIIINNDWQFMQKDD